MKWSKRKPVNPDDEFDLIMNRIASVRGIKDISDWINPSKRNLHSPYALMNIDALVERIIKGIHKDENFVIVADIDGDGVCSTAIMYRYLKSLTDNVRYIHSQRSKGHGVETVLDQINESDDIVLIVDSSSNSNVGCTKLKEMGKDVLIIDHHIVEVENPDALIVNCQMGSYKNKNLSGSAMCLKVCQVIDEYLGIDLSGDFYDLSAVGLVGDMMDVSDMENRYLIHRGINAIQNLGLKEILKQSNIDYLKGINTTNISFKVTPIISACSRFDRIELALELLTTDDEDRAKELTKEMIVLNERRKSEQKEIVESVLSKVDSSNNLIVIIDNDISSGFKGLVATEIVEKFSKPAFVLSEVFDEGELVGYVGSARSVGLLSTLDVCNESGLFNFATGHHQAHGVGFNKENLNAIITYFNENIRKDSVQKVVEYDLEIDCNDIDEMDIKEVEKISKIVGVGFQEPRFKITGIQVTETSTKKLGNHMRAVMGANNDTVKIICENNFNLMKFRSNEMYAKDIEIHYEKNVETELEVVGSLNLNEFYNWGTRKNVITSQVFIDDYKIVEL